MASNEEKREDEEQAEVRSATEEGGRVQKDREQIMKNRRQFTILTISGGETKIMDDEGTIKVVATAELEGAEARLFSRTTEEETPPEEHEDKVVDTADHYIDNAGEKADESSDSEGGKSSDGFDANDPEATTLGDLPKALKGASEEDIKTAKRKDSRSGAKKHYDAALKG